MSHVSRWPIESHVMKMLPHPSGLMVDLGGATWGRPTQRAKPTVKLLPSGIKVKSPSAPLDRSLLRFNQIAGERVSETINRFYAFTVFHFTGADLYTFVLRLRCYTSFTCNANVASCRVQLVGRCVFIDFHFCISKPLIYIVSHISWLLCEQRHFRLRCLCFWASGTVSSSWWWPSRPQTVLFCNVFANSSYCFINIDSCAVAQAEEIEHLSLVYCDKTDSVGEFAQGSAKQHLVHARPPVGVLPTFHYQLLQPTLSIIKYYYY